MKNIQAFSAMLIIAGFVLCAVASLVIAGPTAVSSLAPYRATGNMEVNIILTAILLSNPIGQVVLFSPMSIAVATSFWPLAEMFASSFFVGIAAFTVLPALGPAIMTVLAVSAASSLSLIQGVLLIGLALVALGFLGIDYSSRQKIQALPR